MKNIAVIGSGTMGNGIAHTFAQFGYQVNLIDIHQEALNKAMDTIGKNLDRQVGKGTLTAAEKAGTLANITTFTEMQTGVANADLIVEAATENLELKLKIFKDLDFFAKPEAILASNTSSISITHIASVTGRSDKVIGMQSITWTAWKTCLPKIMKLKCRPFPTSIVTLYFLTRFLSTGSAKILSI